MKSLNRLLPVIKDIAGNETDYIIKDYYKKIIYSTNRSIAALNNLVSLFIMHTIILYQTIIMIQIAALENNDDDDDDGDNDDGDEGKEKELQAGSGDITTPTDPSVDDKKVCNTINRAFAYNKLHIVT